MSIVDDWTASINRLFCEKGFATAVVYCSPADFCAAARDVEITTVIVVAAEQGSKAASIAIHTDAGTCYLISNRWACTGRPLAVSCVDGFEVLPMTRSIGE